MNIKEVEKITGISSQNIRFYEKYELVQPVRNANNGYREYNAELPVTCKCRSGKEE